MKRVEDFDNEAVVDEELEMICRGNAHMLKKRHAYYQAEQKFLFEKKNSEE